MTAAALVVAGLAGLVVGAAITLLVVDAFRPPPPPPPGDPWAFPPRQPPVPAVPAAVTRPRDEWERVVPVPTVPFRPGEN